MKLLNKFLVASAAALTLAGMTACSDDEPELKHFDSKDVDFTYNVDGEEYTLDYYVVSNVKFNNTSSKTGSVHWDFGDGTESTESSPVHKYVKAGTYDVTLTIDGVGSTQHPILIYDIVPILTVAEQSTDIVENNNTTLSFNLELPNPENLKVRYEWKFPEGTMDEDGNELTTFTGYSDANGNIEYPGKVKFRNIGSQKVEISSWFDLDGENRRLEDTYLNVQVGCAEPAATIYYAQRGGNIKALKIVDTSTLPKGTKVMPFDMGVSAGQTVMNLVYADVNETDGDGNPVQNGYIYILDAGKQYYYINDESGLMGDGMINVMRPDGTGVNTVITNVGGNAFSDPFLGWADNQNLYYTDRNTGFSSIELTARSAVQGKTLNGSTYQRDSYIVQNNLIPYYGRGIAYGAISTGLYRDSKNVWWWAKNYSGTGIYRFKNTDIYKTQKEAEAAKLPYAIVCYNAKIRSFAVDETRGNLFMWRLDGTPGFYHYALPGDQEGSPAQLGSVAMDADPVNTTDAEGLCTTQMAVDQETGLVYFCFRPTATDGSKMAAGITYYDPATKKMTHYGDANDLGMGICINPHKTKLF